MQFALSLPPPGVEVLLLALVLAAAVYDALYRRIPNWLNVSGAVLGLTLNGFLYGGPGLAKSFIGLIVGFGIYFVLYALRVMGAGDVKLMAAVGAVVGWQNWFGIFIPTAFVGGILAIIVSILKGRLLKTIF